jgi:hypothetical protein
METGVVESFGKLVLALIQGLAKLETFPGIGFCFLGDQRRIIWNRIIPKLFFEDQK